MAYYYYDLIYGGGFVDTPKEKIYVCIYVYRKFKFIILESYIGSMAYKNISYLKSSIIGECIHYKFQNEAYLTLHVHGNKPHIELEFKNFEYFIIFVDTFLNKYRHIEENDGFVYDEIILEFTHANYQDFIIDLKKYRFDESLLYVNKVSDIC